MQMQDGAASLVCAGSTVVTFGVTRLTIYEAGVDGDRSELLASRCPHQEVVGHVRASRLAAEIDAVSVDGHGGEASRRQLADEQAQKLRILWLAWQITCRVRPG